MNYYMNFKQRQKKTSIEWMVEQLVKLKENMTEYITNYRTTNFHSFCVNLYAHEIIE